MSWFSWFTTSKANEDLQNDDLELLDCPEVAEEVLNSLKDRVEELESELESAVFQRDSAEMLVADLRDELESERSHKRLLAKELEDVSNFWNSKREAIDAVLDANEIEVSTMKTEDIVHETEDVVLPPFPEMTTLEDINPGIAEDLLNLSEDLPEIEEEDDEEDSPWD